MIVLTVKTLDSQNHTFTVDDDITVEEFKVKIADTVNIPADTQRIIYCGRVLQDEAKLSDYDVNGKVVHLVQRPPPGANPPTTRSSSPQPSRRNANGGSGGGGGGGFRGFESGNTVYLGSMAFPSNLMESQGIVPPPPTHSLAGSRLNVARRMLRRAEAVIALLENPSARPSDVVNPDEQQDEEVTPIIEARVIVPPGNSEHIDEAMVISAVQNSLFDSGAIPIGSQVTVDSNIGSGNSESNTGTSTPEEAGNGDNAQNERGSSANNGRPLAENASRTSEMADLLTMLNQLQTRFAPFLERYRQFMIDDPIVPSENTRQTQVMLSRVSEVLHFLGHAYHSLSDIIIRVRTPRPRPLLCRPILIQHSAVVQTGIPIQVEVAQFNLSTDRPPNTTTTSTTTTTNNTTTTTTTVAATTTAASTTTTASTTSTTSSGNDTNTIPTTTSQQQQQPTVNIRGFPFIPAASMRVQSFPIELRTTARPIGVNISQRSNNNGNTNETTTSSTTSANAGTTTTTSTTAPSDNAGFQLPNFNNSSVEFFMEVTPESTLNGPPPEFLQSLVQMAGQIMTRVTTTTATTSTSSSAPTTSTTASGDGQPQTGQNSQARGNTQTHPTTATHTRSTSRPHVHLAQQAMQGGFDPFLPCNSHHITHRRRHQQQQQQQAQQSQQQQQQQQPQAQVFNLRDGLQAIRNLMTSAGVAAGGGTTGTTTTTGDEQRRQNDTNGTSDDSNRQDGNVPHLINTTDEFYSALRSVLRQRDSRRRGFDDMSTSSGQTSNENRENAAQTNRASLFGTGLPPNLQNLFASLPNMLQGPTIAEILHQLPSDDSTVRPGESMITDLIMLLSNNLTLLDMITLNSGNFEPLNRVSNEIQQFFMTRVLDGSTSQEAIDRGVERFINEMQPFFQNFGRLRVRDNIDIIRSVEQLFRRRLPDIITTAANLNAANMRDLVNHCLNLAKLTCTLALHASANGLAGVEETFQQIVTSYMPGIPGELQNWTIMTSCANLRHFMSNLGSSDVESYIVRNSDMPTEPERQQNETRTETTPPTTTTTTTTTTVTEPMELDVEDETSGATALSEELEDPEPLPNVVIGSESWHNQLPEDWVPIITRDVQRQRRQNPQTPFSDAYLSGMPTKRRKIVNSSKPQGSLPQVISESVRRAVTTTGLTSVAPLEVVSQAAGNCTDVQTAYRNLLRTTVQTALRDNEDFTPERFPNAATYFKTP